MKPAMSRPVPVSPITTPTDRLTPRRDTAYQPATTISSNPMNVMTIPCQLAAAATATIAMAANGATSAATAASLSAGSARSGFALPIVTSGISWLSSPHSLTRGGLPTADEHPDEVPR